MTSKYLIRAGILIYWKFKCWVSTNIKESNIFIWKKHY